MYVFSTINLYIPTKTFAKKIICQSIFLFNIYLLLYTNIYIIYYIHTPTYSLIYVIQNYSFIVVFANRCNFWEKTHENKEILLFIEVIFWLPRFCIFPKIQFL